MTHANKRNVMNVRVKKETTINAALEDPHFNWHQVIHLD